jgi:tetratricopeptide (TPR) repeat protein
LRIAALVLLAFVLRAAWPLADPPRRLSWSGGIWTDPATVVHSARNAILWGEWVRDDSRDLAFYPLLNGLTWLAYGALGPGRLATQLLAALLGAGTVAAVGWAVSRAAGRGAATVAAALVATCWWLVQFGRVPIAENLVACLLSVSAALVLGRGPRARFAAGLVAGVAVFFGKLHAVPFLAALFLFVFARERRARAIGEAALGTGFAAAAWALLVLRPFQAEVLDQLRGSAVISGEPQALRSPLDALAEPLRAIQRSWLFVRMPVLGVLGAVFALGTLAHPQLRRERMERGTAIFALWFVAAWMYHALLPYQAPRHFLPAAVALVAGAACQLEELGRGAGFPRRPPRGPLLLAAWCIGLLGAGIAIALSVGHAAWALRDLVTPSASSPALRELLGDLAGALNPFPAVLAVGATAAAGLALLAARAWRAPALDTRRAARAARALLALALASEAAQLAWWATHRTYALEDAKRSLDAVVGESAVLFGPIAPALVQDGRRVGVPHFASRVEALPPEVTHVATLGDPSSSPEFAAELRAGMVLVGRWPLRSHRERFVGVARVPNAAYVPAPFERALDAVSAGRPRDALDLLADLPESPDVRRLEARAWFELRDEARAASALRRAIELRPTSPADHYNLGRLLERGGDRDGATALWRRGLSLDPTDPDLIRALGLGPSGP